MKKTTFKKLRDDYNETHNKRISQQYIADKAFVSKSTISRIENGEIEPSIEVIKAYCEIFNVSIEYLTNIKQTNDTLSAREMGISEEVISTYHKIDELSNSDENILAVLNSLIGNEQYTVDLLNSILYYLSTQEFNGSNRMLDDFLTERVFFYINNIMKPQLQKVIKHNISFKESASNYMSEDE